MLSIGGNHLIHALRRNVNMKILMFNNQIYGLTKGQYSPTSEIGKVTKSTPFGSLDHPFNPISVALGAEATFVARTHDMDRKHMTEVFRRAQRAPRRVVRRGVPELQRLQRRRVRHDPQQGRPARHAHRPEARRADPLRRPSSEMGVVMNEFGEAKIVRVDDVGDDRLLVHDETPPRPVARVRAVAAGRAPRDADPGRRVPRGRASVVRGRDAASARRRRRAQRPRRPREAAALRARPGRSAARPRPSVGATPAQSQRCGTPSPTGASGVKNVVFCGMRARSIAAARVCATDTGLHRIAALAAPLSTSAATACASCR